MKIQFIEVGPNNSSWTAEVSELEYEALYREVKDKAMLMSRTIDFSYDGESKSGEVIVGGFRTVGKFKVLETVH
ncbi:hypothetical protein [Marinobacterium jannaschii]|uniref:hypothetical protein n=1 Tax=Marinobacterium jannaschii TaxID=64970 RepID=UPI00056D15E5|nr:hypothetical protein [Marinobacterium jannaschii]